MTTPRYRMASYGTITLRPKGIRAGRLVAPPARTLPSAPIHAVPIGASRPMCGARGDQHGASGVLTTFDDLDFEASGLGRCGACLRAIVAANAELIPRSAGKAYNNSPTVLHVGSGLASSDG